MLPTARAPRPATLAVLAAVTAILIQHSHGSHLNGGRWKRQSPCRRNQFPCNSGKCIEVFLLCDGKIHCDDGSDETATICQRKTCPSQAFKCKYGACIDLNGLCNGVEECVDGSDETSCTASTRPSEPENSSALGPPMQSGSEVRCPALTIPSRDITCKLNDRRVDCSEPALPGTTAMVECRGFYVNKEESSFDTICQFNGQWSRHVTPCQPKCGEPTPEGLPFIAGGTKAKNGEFPWHAGIYRFNHDRENYEQICGGNVISERLIVSAGHCFWNMATSSIVDLKDYKVAVGKYYREWNNNRDMVYVQTPEIEKVVTPQRFRGNIRSWQNDIALIKLKDVIRMTVAVRPICVDFNNNYDRQFVPGTKGIVVGWGMTEKMLPGEVLYKTNLPYISFEECEKEVPKPFLMFLTNDKICAGYRNGTSVCPGDGGGGYATQFNDGRWYLMGIVSVGVPARNSEACNVEQYATFTKVSNYYSFIQQNQSQ
ncbi:hypothetical protein R5R35_012674 [Gryllus longicercus]|uniref:Peptidase S1 domain-containing protein n=1 Tax=Gryllus longicercus TaxID=2509291 RepID=A0AAN9VKJ6_9ORTH